MFYLDVFPSLCVQQNGSTFLVKYLKRKHLSLLINHSDFLQVHSRLERTWISFLAMNPDESGLSLGTKGADEKRSFCPHIDEASVFPHVWHSVENTDFLSPVLQIKLV